MEVKRNFLIAINRDQMSATQETFQVQHRFVSVAICAIRPNNPQPCNRVACHVLKPLHERARERLPIIFNFEEEQYPYYSHTTHSSLLLVFNYECAVAACLSPSP
jgi:hypothetical protein